MKCREDTSQDRKLTEFWQHMQLRHNVNSGHIRYDPVRNYAAMLKMSDPSEWARLFDSAE